MRNKVETQDYLRDIKREVFDMLQQKGFSGTEIRIFGRGKHPTVYIQSGTSMNSEQVVAFSKILTKVAKLVDDLKHSLGKEEDLLKESNRITLYAGYFHDDMMTNRRPIFSNNKADVAGCEYTAKISAPYGTYVMFRWNNEDCYFEKTVSPKEAIAQWTKLFQEQEDNGDDCYYEEDISGGWESGVEDYESPKAAAKDLYEMIIDQEPDGDSNYGVIWKKIEEF